MAVVLNLIVLLFLAASLGIWGEIARRWRAGQPILAWEAREPVPWGALEIVIAVGIYLLAAQALLSISRGPEPVPAAPPAQEESLTAVGQGLVDSLFANQTKVAPADATAPASKPPTASEAIQQLVRQIVFQVVTLLACLAFLRVGTRASWRDLGVDRSDLAKYGRAGFFAFVAVAPPVFLLQRILVEWFPSKHPIVEALGQHPSSTLFLCATLLAVVVAPWCEEFFFRVLLQGWLETADAKLRIEPDEPALQSPARWPMIVSSLVFAAMHSSHGPDPIPLFLLALAMGYLYRQTHRIWPSFVMHACFNATSMVMLGLSLLETGGGK